MLKRLTILILLLALPAFAQPPLPKPSVFIQVTPVQKAQIDAGATIVVTTNTRPPPSTTQTVTWGWASPTATVSSVSIAIGTNGGWIQTNTYAPTTVMATFTNVPTFAIAKTNYAKLWFVGTNGLLSPVVTASYSGELPVWYFINPTTNTMQEASSIAGPWATVSSPIVLTNPPGIGLFRLANPSAPQVLSMLGTGTNLVIVKNPPLPNVVVSNRWACLP